MTLNLPSYRCYTIKENLDIYQINLAETVKKIFLILTVSSVFIGGAGFFEVYLGYLFLGTNPCILTCFSAALMTFGVYSLDKLTKSDEDKTNMPERQKFLSGHKTIAVLCALGAYGVAVMITAFSNPLALPVILSPVIVNAVYATKLHPCVPRLKDIPIMKNVVVALIWAMGGALLPAVNMTHAQNTLVAAVFYFVAVKMFINTVLYDVRDVDGDRAKGMRTMPIILGEKKTIAVLMLLNSTLLLWLRFAEIHLQLIATILVLYGYVYIFYFRKRRNHLALDFFVDGEWMLAFALLLVLKGPALAI